MAPAVAGTEDSAVFHAFPLVRATTQRFAGSSPALHDTLLRWIASSLRFPRISDIDPVARTTLLSIMRRSGDYE
jgi:hypothetical protein